MYGGACWFMASKSEIMQMIECFQTLSAPVEIRGVGLHSGASVQARLLPREAVGIVFTRVDLAGAPSVAAILSRVSSTTHATTLQNDNAGVATTEHLLAALWTRGITNCEIELDGPEVPILDGSARDWCRLLDEAGSCSPRAQASHQDETSARRPIWSLREPVWVAQGEAFMLGLPHDALRVSVAVEYSPVYVGKHGFDAVVDWHGFKTEIAPARTFTLEEWIEPLRAQGLIHGGSADNAVVLGPDAPSSAWRFADEVARHKALDVLGDVALLFGANGGRLHAHLIAARAGHGTHRLWMQECLKRNALVGLDPVCLESPGAT